VNMLSVDDYLNHWRVHYSHVVVDVDGELTEEMRAKAYRTVTRANELLEAFGEERAIASGWRPKAVNAVVPNAAKFSRHMTCEAIDLADPDGDLDNWCMNNTLNLQRLGLFLEHPSMTKGWCHVQIIAPKSGNRVFYP